MAPYDGSGNYTKVHDWTTDKANSVKVRADRMDEQFDDIVVALSKCVLKDGTQVITQNIPFNGKKITNLGNPTSAQDAATKAYVDGEISGLGDTYYTEAEVDALLAGLGDTYYTETEVDALFAALGDTYYSESEVDAAFVPQSRTVTGSGLVSGGGDLSENRTLTVTGAAASDFRTGTDTTKALTAGAVFGGMAEVTLTDAETIAVDLSTGFDFVVTLEDNRTLGNPTNAKAGQRGRIRIVQDGTGSRTLAYGSNWSFPGDEAPTLSTDPGAEDFLDYEVVSASRIRASLTNDIP